MCVYIYKPIDSMSERLPGSPLDAVHAKSMYMLHNCKGQHVVVKTSRQ